MFFALDFAVLFPLLFCFWAFLILFVARGVFVGVSVGGLSEVWILIGGGLRLRMGFWLQRECCV